MRGIFGWSLQESSIPACLGHDGGGFGQGFHPGEGGFIPLIVTCAALLASVSCLTRRVWYVLGLQQVWEAQVRDGEWGGQETALDPDQ